MQQSMPDTATPYHSAESAVQHSPTASVSSRIRVCCSILQDDAERAAAALAAASASSSDAFASTNSTTSPGAATAPVGPASHKHGSLPQVRAGSMSKTAQTPGSSSSNNKAGARRSLEWSQVAADDSALQSAASASSTAAAKQLQLAHLPSAVSACYDDALSKFCSTGAVQGTHHQQQHQREQHHRKVVWQQEFVPEAPATHAAGAAQTAASSAKGSTGTHSGSTAYHSAGSR